MSACMIVLTDEKGRPLGQTLGTAIFMAKGMVIRPSSRVKIEADGAWAHMEVRCVGAGETPGPLVWSHDNTHIIPVRAGLAIDITSWVVEIQVKDEVHYV